MGQIKEKRAGEGEEEKEMVIKREKNEKRRILIEKVRREKKKEIPFKAEEKKSI